MRRSTFSEEGSCELVDLGSRNGTALNGRRIQAHTPYVLREGDNFRIEEFSLGLVFGDTSNETITRYTRAEDELFVDTEAMEVWMGDKQLPLRQARVLKLLAYMYTNKGKVCSEEGARQPHLGLGRWHRSAAVRLRVPAPARLPRPPRHRDHAAHASLPRQRPRPGLPPPRPPPARRLARLRAIAT